MNTIEIMMQGHVDRLLSDRRRMISTVRIKYQNGEWSAAGDKARARTRSSFRIINKQLRRASAELAAYRVKKGLA